METVIPYYDHTHFQSPVKTTEAKYIRFLIPPSMVLSDAAVLSRYVNALTDFSDVPWISTCGWIEVCPGGCW